MRRLSLLIALLLVLSGCGGGEAFVSSDPNAPCTPVGSGTTDLTKKPELTIPDADPPAETVFADIVCGTGEEAKVGSNAVIKYVGALYKGGEEFGSTWRDDTTTPVKVGSDTIKGFTTGLSGMKVGGRRMVIIPAKDGFGDQGRGSIPANAALVFILDLVEIKAPPARTPCTPSGKGSTDLSKKPVPVPHTGAAPKETTFTDIVCGTGAQADEGSSVSVQYVGALLSGGKEFDTSWGERPLDFTVGTRVVPGFTIGVTGMKVGGRRQVIIPAKDGYGPEGSPPDIPPNATLVFVIDLLKA